MIAYTPIDIKWSPPDYEKIKKYFLENHMNNLSSTTGYTSLLCAIASPHAVTNWRDANELFPDINYDTLRENPVTYFAPGITKLFPELIELFNLLPFKQFIGAMFNMHVSELSTHRDRKINIGLGPERYNVLVSPHYKQDSFYLTKNFNSKKYYTKNPIDYPIYAFNNNDLYHGADIVLDQRIIIICMGILDKERHFKLINDSVKKFKEYVIEI
jgi:hypothetical protein